MKRASVLGDDGKKAQLQQYIHEEVNRVRTSTLNSRLDALLALGIFLGERDWESASRSDVIRVIGEHRFHKGARTAPAKPLGPGRPLAATTKYQWAVHMRVFYKWLLDTDDTPPQFRRLPFRKKDESVARAKELALLPEEVRKLLAGARTARDRCIVALGIEGSWRASELAALRLDTMEKRNHGWWMWLNPTEPSLKTGPRDVPVPAIAAREFIDAWLKEHPRRHEPRAPLFVSLSNRNYGQRMSGKTIGEVITRCAKRAGLRHTHAHMLRHTGTTFAVARNVNPEAIRLSRGWSSLQMLKTYTHASPHYESMMLEAHGLESEEPGIRDLLGASACVLCGDTIPIGASECPHCGVPNADAVAESQARRQREQTVAYVAQELACFLGWVPQGDGDGQRLVAATKFLSEAYLEETGQSSQGDDFVRWCLRRWASRGGV